MGEWPPLDGPCTPDDTPPPEPMPEAPYEEPLE